jgi:hypothetical protein
MATPTKPTKLPEWIPDNTTNITEPIAGKKAVGWLASEEPPNTYFNWLINLTYQWLKHIEIVLDYMVFGDSVTQEITFPGIVNFEGQANFSSSITSKTFKGYDRADFYSELSMYRLFETNYSIEMKEDNESSEGYNQIMLQNTPFGINYETILQNRTFLHNVDVCKIPPYSHEITYTGSWSDVAGASEFFGSSKQTSTAGDTAEIDFFGTGITVHLGQGTGTGATKVEISNDGGSTYFAEKSFSTTGTFTQVGNKYPLWKGLEPDEYHVKLTNIEGGSGGAFVTQLSYFAYETYMIQKPTTNAMQTFDEIKVPASDVSTASDYIILRGCKVDDVVRFTTTGTLPSPLAVSTDYYVVTALQNVSNNRQQVQISATQGGAVIDLTTAGTGTHTAINQSIMTVDDMPPATPLFYGGWDNRNAIDTNAWNYLSTRAGLVTSIDNGATVEFKFYGTKIWVISRWLTEGDVNTAVLIDGVTSYNKEDTIQFHNVGTTDEISSWVRLDNGTLSPGWHTLKMTTDIVSAKYMILSGFGYYSPNTWYEIDNADVDISTDKITVNSHDFVNGDIVNFNEKETLPTPLAENTDYFIINAGGNDFELSLTSGGAKIDITDVGSKSFYISKRLSVTTKALGFGKDTIIYGSDDSAFTWNGSASDNAGGWNGNVAETTAYNRQTNFTTAIDDYCEITAPANTKAIYFINATANDETTVHAQLDGAQDRYLDNNISDSTYNNKASIQLLYDDVVDGSLGGKVLKLINMATDTNFRVTGVIFQIGDSVETSGIYNFPAWGRNSVGAYFPAVISNTFRLEAYGKTTDTRSGRQPMIHTGFLWQNSNTTYFRTGMLLTAQESLFSVFTHGNSTPIESGGQNITTGLFFSSESSGYGRMVNIGATSYVKAQFMLDRIH